MMCCCLTLPPLNLGIETLGSVMTTLIEANTTIPISKQETFSTAADNQTSVEIHVLQGNRDMAMHNRTIGKFHLDGISPAPRGTPQIEVAFDIDADGILNVSAKDKATGKEQSIRIEASSGLSEAEIEKMRQDARVHEAEDKKRRQEVELLNQADSLIHTTRKNLEEYGDKLPTDKKQAIEVAMARIKSLHGEKNVQELQSAIDQLSQAWAAASQDMHASQQAPSDNAYEQDPDDVEEADFEIIDENKKRK